MYIHNKGKTVTEILFNVDAITNGPHFPLLCPPPPKPPAPGY